MGLTAIVSGSSAGIPSISVVGMGVGSLFASVGLVFLLGYLDLYDAAERDDERQRRTIVAAILPLVVVFAAIVLFQALRVLNPA